MPAANSLFSVYLYQGLLTDRRYNCIMHISVHCPCCAGLSISDPNFSKAEYIGTGKSNSYIHQLPISPCAKITLDHQLLEEMNSSIPTLPKFNEYQKFREVEAVN
jgi:hypothetical protein